MSAPQGLHCRVRCNMASSAASLVLTLLRVHKPHLYSVPKLPFLCTKFKFCGWSTFKSCFRSQDLVRACSLCPVWHWTRRMPELAMERDKWETVLPYAAGSFPCLCCGLRWWLCCCFFTPPKLGHSHRWPGEKLTWVQQCLVQQRGTGSHLETWYVFNFLFWAYFSLCIWNKGQVVWCVWRWRRLFSLGFF